MKPVEHQARGTSLSRLAPDALRRLIDVGGEVVSELDHEAVLQRVIEAARELTGARYGRSACSTRVAASSSAS